MRQSSFVLFETSASEDDPHPRVATPELSCTSSYVPRHWHLSGYIQSNHFRMKPVSPWADRDPGRSGHPGDSSLSAAIDY